jgi:hypothetical protein
VIWVDEWVRKEIVGVERYGATWTLER